MADRSEMPPGYPGSPFGGFGQPGMPRGGLISPYQNIDPSIFKSAEPQYIMPEGASARRGRLELAFTQIGCSVMAGCGIGGANGLYKGIGDQTFAHGAWSVRRSQMLNYITKYASSSARATGAIALMYSCFGVLYSSLRGTDDELNTLVAGTSTGLLFKSTAGLKRCATGGGVGLGLASIYCMYTSGDKLKEILGFQ